MTDPTLVVCVFCALWCGALCIAMAVAMYRDTAKREDFLRRLIEHDDKAMRDALGECRDEINPPSGHADNCPARFNRDNDTGYGCRCGWPELLARIDAALEAAHD